MIGLFLAMVTLGGVIGPVQADLEPVTGIASWYHWHDGEAAAGPALREDGWRGSTVRVCGRTCVNVKLTDWCQCWRGTSSERIIDLDTRTFLEVCGPLSRGVCQVTVRG